MVGSPAEVADELQAWAEETDVDGFNLPYAITPGTFADVVDHLVPELQSAPMRTAVNELRSIG